MKVEQSAGLMMAGKNNTIRRDIWAVKEWDSACEDWCYVMMFYEKWRLQEWIKGEQRVRRTMMKVVHPAQWVVEAFVAVGNQIVGRKAAA